ncbi:hypothetical protein KM043_008122 [Ampulex compressa]|nr:hypothetical protein KM043_008122 [Ampulex compressa]
MHFKKGDGKQSFEKENKKDRSKSDEKYYQPPIKSSSQPQFRLHRETPSTHPIPLPSPRKSPAQEGPPVLLIGWYLAIKSDSPSGGKKQALISSGLRKLRLPWRRETTETGRRSQVYVVPRLCPPRCSIPPAFAEDSRSFDVITRLAVCRPLEVERWNFGGKSAGFFARLGAWFGCTSNWLERSISVAGI